MNPILETRPRPYEGWNMTPQPTVGFAWNPRVDRNGFLGKLMGGDGTVFRGSYSLRRMGYAAAVLLEQRRELWRLLLSGLAFRSWYQLRSRERDAGRQSLFGGDPLPPLTFTPALYQPSAPLSEFTFRAGRLSGFANDIKQPYTQSWNFGIQRRLASSLVSGTAL